MSPDKDHLKKLHPFSSIPLPKEKPIPCRYCPRSYKAVNVRDLHERIHLTPYICDYCKQTFSIKSHLRNHLEIHRRMVNPWQKVGKNTHTIRFKADAAQIQCDYCEKRFYSKLGYTLHIRQKHYDELEPETCFVKEESFRSDDEEDENIEYEYLEPQVVEIHNDKRKNGHVKEFSCACGENFQEFIDLVRHESKKHTDAFEKMVKGLKDLLLYVINRLDDESDTKKPLSEVKKEENIEPIIQISYDDVLQYESNESEPEKKVPIKKEFKGGPVRPRKRYNPKNPKQDKFLCQYCDKQLAHRKSLEYHVAKKHQNVPIYRCKFCNRYFQEETDYLAHIKSHDSDPDMCCSECGFLCKGTAILRRHMLQKHRTTELEPRFFCPTCNKGFYYKCKLDEHEIIHKPHAERNARFMCDTCNMAFTRKSALNRHKLSHDDSTKKYTCTFCAKTFRRKQHLNAHLAMHTGARAREEVCADCGSTYSERRGLNNHMLRVHGRPLEGYKKQIKIVAE